MKYKVKGSSSGVESWFVQDFDTYTEAKQHCDKLNHDAFSLDLYNVIYQVDSDCEVCHGMMLLDQDTNEPATLKTVRFEGCKCYPPEGL